MKTALIITSVILGLGLLYYLGLYLLGRCTNETAEELEESERDCHRRLK